MPDAVVPEISAASDIAAFLPRFGLSEFRLGQREVIDAVLAGEDCLCVMPTGGGKSLCYQLPAIARPGVTLVVSPLIALMHDQVSQLESLGLRATFINSTLDPGEQQARLDRMAAGAYDLVYVAAERFRSPRFLEAVRATTLQLLAIDEAHCISEWGHDFRPDYARLGRYRAKLGRPTTIALTATATDAVRRDIVEQLDLRQPRVFITGFARPNLHYEVQTTTSERQKHEVLLAFLREYPGPGIIYASTRKRSEEVAELIRKETRLKTGVYHAGLLHEDRRRAQEAFMDGALGVVVATNAFGMGIDKADVRFVLHYNLPGTLEAYYQEAGRAGRDGQPSRCLLLYSAGDRYIQEFFIDSAYPPREVVKQVYEFLRVHPGDPIELTQQEIKETLGLNIGAEGVGTCEQLLDKAGVLERLEARQNMAVVRLDSDLPTLVDMLPRQAVVQRRVLQAVEQLVGQRRNELVYFRPQDLAQRTGLDQPALTRSLRELKQLSAFDYVPPFRGRAIHMLSRDKPFESLAIDFEALELRKQEEYQKLDRVISFAKTRACRQQEILRYFGQSGGPSCGHCDNCQPAGERGGEGKEVTTDEPAVLDVVQKVLSGVARTHGRVGKHAVAQMLCGSKSEKMTRLRFDRLSTYGLLAHLKQDEVAALIDALVKTGCIEQVEANHQRPTVQLTEHGTLVMRGQIGPQRLLLPDRLLAKICPRTARRPAAPPPSSVPLPTPTPTPTPTPSPSPSPALSPAPAPLPRPVAEERRASSPANTPSPVPAPSPIPSDTPTLSPNPLPPATSAGRGQPSHYWTWRLLAAGFTPDECATIRGLAGEVVLDHALRAAEAGMAVRAEWFLSPELIAALEQTIGERPPPRIRPLLDRLPRGTRYEQVQWFLKCRHGAAVPETHAGPHTPDAEPLAINRQSDIDCVE